MGWENKFAKLWNSVVIPPSRPSVSELTIIQKYIKLLKKEKQRRIKTLILGSTPEFRDLCFEENCDITVIEKNKGYYNEISKQLRHKEVMNKEKTVFAQWQDMYFSDEYDLVLGDLAMGNIAKEELEKVIENISKALTNKGYYIEKACFVRNNYKATPTEEVIRKYNDSFSYNPYESVFYDSILNNLNGSIMDFKKIHSEWEILNKKGILKNEDFNILKNMKYDSMWNIRFEIHNEQEFLTIIKKYFTNYELEFSKDSYSQKIPLYVSQK